MPSAFVNIRTPSVFTPPAALQALPIEPKIEVTRETVYSTSDTEKLVEWLADIDDKIDNHKAMQQAFDNSLIDLIEANQKDLKARIGDVEQYLSAYTKSSWNLLDKDHQDLKSRLSDIESHIRSLDHMFALLPPPAEVPVIPDPPMIWPIAVMTFACWFVSLLALYLALVKH